FLFLGALDFQAMRKTDHHVRWWLEYGLYGAGILIALTATSPLGYGLGWLLSTSRFFLTERLDRWQSSLLLGSTLLIGGVMFQVAVAPTAGVPYLRAFAEALAGSPWLAV